MKHMPPSNPSNRDTKKRAAGLLWIWLNAVVCIWLIESSRKLLAQRLNRLALSFFVAYKNYNTPNKRSCQYILEHLFEKCSVFCSIFLSYHIASPIIRTLSGET